MSMVVDQLEESVVESLPGETDEENATYLRDLIRRLELRATDLDGVRFLTPRYDTDDAATVLGRPLRPSEADHVTRALQPAFESQLRDAVLDAAGDHL